MMIKIHYHNQILRTGLMLLLAIIMLHVLPVQAAEPVHAVDGDETTYASKTITLPFRQTWTGGGEQTVTYTLTPLGATTVDPGYNLDTAEAVRKGWISWTVTDSGETNPGTITLDGSTGTGISYSWTKAGLYLFDLKVSTQDRTNYQYDHSTYRIRVYVRSATHFITVEKDPDDTTGTEGGKVSAIVYRHTYSSGDTPSPNPGGGDDGGSGGDGGNTTPVTPTDPVTPNTVPNADGDGSTEISEGGDTGTLWEEILKYLSEYGNETDPNNPGSVSEWGGLNHRNAWTGDDSNMTLYAFIAILAIITLAGWMIHHRRA